VRLPVQVFDGDAARTLAHGETVNVSQSGLLIEGQGVRELSGVDVVQVHVGLPREIWDEEGATLQARVARIEEGRPRRVAVEVAGSPASFLSAPELVGKHPTVLELKRRVSVVAEHNVNVLITGETGTGKNLVAEAIHRYSPRSCFRFVRLNCPSVPDTLLESQLFGHEKGAFTDAKSASPGVFRLANRGTLVLDEISAISYEVQSKLLQAIEEKRFMPVGASSAIEVDVRIIAVTNENLEKRAREGTFRKDLFYRLNEVALTVSPLRERKSDIPLLADYFLRKYSLEFGKPYAPLTTGMMRVLQSYNWPGNVRELESTIKRAILMGEFRVAHLEERDEPRAAEPEEAEPSVGRAVDREAHLDLKGRKEQAEREAVLQALKMARANRTKAAKVLGISVRTLHRKLKKHGIRL